MCVFVGNDENNTLGLVVSLLDNVYVGTQFVIGFDMKEKGRLKQ